MKIKDKTAKNSFIAISEPEIIGKEYLVIDMQGVYFQESKPRCVQQFITKRQAKKIIARLNLFIKS